MKADLRSPYTVLWSFLTGGIVGMTTGINYPFSLGLLLISAFLFPLVWLWKRGACGKILAILLALPAAGTGTATYHNLMTSPINKTLTVYNEND